MKKSEVEDVKSGVCNNLNFRKISEVNKKKFIINNDKLYIVPPPIIINRVWKSHF
jgi:hypothetical protein